MNNCPSFCMCDFCATTHFPNEPVRGSDKWIENKMEKLEKKLSIQEKRIENLLKSNEFYADTRIYNRPDRDRNGMSGMSGMSSQTDFEIEDGEWKITNGEKEHYCYGKLARECQAKDQELLKELEMVK